MDEFYNQNNNNNEQLNNVYFPEVAADFDGGHYERRYRRRSKVKVYISIILATSIISSTVVGGILYSMFTDKLNKQADAINSIKASGSVSTYQPTKTSLSTTSSTSMYSAVDIAKKVSPSIVGIRTTVTTAQNSFFGNNSQSVSEGSGIIISADGYIMTNYHVVQYADSKNNFGTSAILEVFLPDKRQAKAKFIGGDETSDLAVIKIDLNDLPAAELGDSSELEVGEPAIAIGNPLGMDFAGSVTVGVVSALNRQVQTDDKTLNLIQTDAAINPGNSGGALVNSRGQVIGINTIKISETGVEGLGFAIPINDAKPIVNQLMTYGYVKGRPFIGISGVEITDIMSRQYNLPVGIYIKQVTSGSGAEKAGIRSGDVLVSLDGTQVKTMSDVDAVKKKHKAGDTVSAVVVRNGNKINISLTFSEDK